MTLFDSNPDFSSVEMRIYNYVLSNTTKVTYMSIQDLSKETYSSTASILRFCKKMGYSGFSEFKFHLKQSIYDNNPSSTTVRNDVRETLELIYEQSITDSFNNAVKNAAQLLATKTMVVFAGLGTSDIAASYAARYFSYVFPYSFRIEDINDYPSTPRLKSPDISKNVCIIALSISGETPEILKYVKSANLANCSLVAITANKYSKLASISDVVISYSLTKLSRNNSDLNSQIPCFYIVELLAQEIYSIKSGIKKNGEML